DTLDGWVTPIQIKQNQNKEVAIEWYSKQLAAFTLAGMAQFNLRAKESNTSAETSLKAEVAVVNSDGSAQTVWGSWCIEAVQNNNYGELGTSEAAVTAWVSGDALAVNDGQRIRFRVYADDTGNQRMFPFTITFYYAGTSSGAS